MFDRFMTPIIAIGLGFLVWLYLRRDQDDFEKEVPVDVVVATPQAQDYELDAVANPRVPVRFTGPPSRLREVKDLLQNDQLRVHRVVTVPEDRLDAAVYELTLRVDSNDIPVPPGVRAAVARIQDRVPVTLRRIVEKSLPVQLRTTARDRVDFEKTVVEPASVTVRGPKEILDQLPAIETALLEIAEPSGDVAETRALPPVAVELVNRQGSKPLRVIPARVQARVTLKPLQKVHELSEVPVHFLTPNNFPFKPQLPNDHLATLTLKVRGPATSEKPVVLAFVDLTNRKFVAGLQPDEAVQIKLPPGYTLAQDPPRISSFKLLPLDAPAKPNEPPFAP
jgi:hypothetical protein